MSHQDEDEPVNHRWVNVRILTGRVSKWDGKPYTKRVKQCQQCGAQMYCEYVQPWRTWWRVHTEKWRIVKRRPPCVVQR